MDGNILLLFPVLFPLFSALLVYLVCRKNEPLCAPLASALIAIELAAVVFVVLRFASHGAQSFDLSGFVGLGLHLTLDGFRIVLICITAFLWMMTALFSQEYFADSPHRARYYFFYLFTLGATVGLFLSADLFTTFLFLEMVGLTSYVMVIHSESALALKAGQTYLAVAIICGMVMLMGLFLLSHHAGTLVISELPAVWAAHPNKAPLYLAGALILVGFGAKAGMFPLHFWLPEAHPVAPAPASALLSGILTKTGVFGILAISSGLFLHDAAWGFLLLCIGMVNMLWGAVLALFSEDLKRTLACSSMSQIGFILVGVGMQGLLGHHNALAVRGTLLHMVNHSLIKLVLFMAAGVVLLRLESTALKDIRGFGRGKPLLLFSFLMGYLGIIGMPLWNGYISKTLLHESIVEYIAELAPLSAQARILGIVEALFLFVGGLTFAYMTKLFVALFVEKGEHARGEEYISAPAALALGLSALILPVLGFFPNKLMDSLAGLGQGFMHGENPAHTVDYFAWVNLKGTVISLCIGAVVYVLVVRGLLMKKDENGRRVYKDHAPSRYTIEALLYRPLIAALLWLLSFVCRLLDTAVDLLIRFAGFLLRPIPMKRYFTPRRERPDQLPAFAFARSLSFGLLLFGLGSCLVLIYLVATAWW